MAEEEDPWDVRIAKTGCAEENERLQLCHADTGDWRKCLEEMAAFRACWARFNNDERTHTKQNTSKANPVYSAHSAGRSTSPPTHTHPHLPPMEHPAFTLAALCSTGGIIGYLRRGSVPSLAAGLVVGGLYGYSGKLMRENADYGIEGAVLASALLVAGSLPRALKLRKPVPVGLSLVGLTALVFYGKKWADFNL